MSTIGLEPRAHQLISNTRQGRSQNFYERIAGSKAETAPYEEVILATPDEIAGKYDVVPYSPILPSEKSSSARLFTELFTTLVGNPESAAALQLDPNKILKHIAELQGVNYLDDFKISPQPAQTQVLPDEQALESGGVPVDLGAQALLQQLANE